MKKILAFVLTFLMLASFFAVPAAPLAAEGGFLVAESYNDMATGAVPGNGAKSSGLSKIVETAPGKDKAVEMAGGVGESSLSYTADVTGSTISMYVDLYYKNTWSATDFYVLDASGKKFTVAYIGADGQIHAGDSRVSEGIARNRAASVQLTYNMKHKKVSIYLDGRALETNRYLGTSALASAIGFGMGVNCNDKSAGLLVDNFAIFEGTRRVKSSDIPKKAYNTEVFTTASAGDAPAEEELVSDTVFMARTFDEENTPEFDGITLNEAGNKIKVDRSVFDGNRYIKLTKEIAAESYIAFSGSTGTRYLVADFDVSTDNNTPAGRLLFIRDGDAASMFNTFLNIATSGDITTADGKFVANVKSRSWVNITVATDVKALTYDVYADGELKYSKLPFANKTITNIPLFRIGCNNAANTGTLLIDNLKVYEGKEPREIEGSVRRSIVTPTATALSYIGSNKVVYPFNSTIYTDNQKSYTKHEIIRENENTVIYAHKEDLETLFGEDLKTGTVHSEKADYYNIEETVKNSGYQLQKMDTRLMIFNKSTVSLSDDKLEEINRYMANVRPSAETIIELFEQNGKNEHPRVLMSKDDLARIKKLYGTDPHVTEWGNNEIERANEMFSEADYEYRIDGTSMRDVNYSVDDIKSVCMAYHLTGNERYAAKAWKFLENICKLDSWNPESYLDVGELSFVVGLGYDWMYDVFNDEQRKFIEENLFKKGVEYTDRLYYNDLRDTTAYTTWWDGTNNWNAVCNGGTMCGAVALMDVYPEVCASMIENAIRGLEYMMPSYYPTGAWEEGGGYWQYALSYVVHTVTSFRNAFGTDFDLMKTPGMDGTGWYGTYLAGATGIMTMGDTNAAFVNNSHVMYMAKEFKDEMLMAARFKEFEKFGHEGGALEMIYYDPELYNENVEVPLDTLMQGMEVISLRESWYDTGSTYLGASGGANKRGHGHMDIGSFVVDMGGERFIQDSGAENYNAKGYFAANRYLYYRSRPEGHNLYVINYEPDNIEYFGMDKNARAEGELVLSKPRGAIGKIDLSDAYAQWANSAVRGFMLSDDRRSVTIRDEISLKEPNSEIQWFLHTKAKVESIEGNKAVLSLNGKKMLVTIDTNAEKWEFKEMEAASISNATKAVVKDTNNASNGLKKLAVVAVGSGDINISAKFRQYDDEMINPEPTKLSIAEWSIPDGEVTPLPEAKAIYVDGALIEDFDPLVTGYSSLVATKETHIPQITAEADGRVELVQATEFGMDSLVKVYAPGSDSIYRTYRINFYKLPPLSDIDGMRRYPVAEITASEVPEEANGVTNVIDEDFGTRWAAEGLLGQWIMIELDDIYPIEKVGVSWMNGDARATTYKLEISTDGVNWTTIFNGISSGTTTKCEYTNAGGAMAKFVRCTGYGNTLNEWNSVTEFEVLGNQR